MQTEINNLKLALVELINIIKKEPDPYFEDLTTAISLYSTLKKSEAEIVALQNKYIPRFSKAELFEELINGVQNRGEEYIKFAPYLIEALYEYGGARKCEDALPDIIRKAAKDNKITMEDETFVNAGTELKGYNRIRFVRNSLKTTGFILDPKDGGKHGVWEITDKAKDWYDRWSQAV
jgi:hypothetical protein